MEAGQFLLRQQHLCRLEAGATLSLTTAQKKRRGKILSSLARKLMLHSVGVQGLKFRLHSSEQAKT